MSGLGYLLLILSALASLLIIYSSIKNGISPMPTSSKVKTKLFQISLNPKPGPIYELGSGWGTLAFTLAKKYPSHHIAAYETSWIPYLYCLVRNYFFPFPNLHFYRVNFYTISLKNASMIFCYLYPAAMQRLISKFSQELPPGTIVVTHTFALPTKKYDLMEEINDLYHTKIYVYYF